MRTEEKCEKIGQKIGYFILALKYVARSIKKTYGTAEEEDEFYISININCLSIARLWKKLSEHQIIHSCNSFRMKKNWTPIFIQMRPFLKIKPLIKLYLGILNKNISITYVLNEDLNCNAVMKMAKKIFHNHWTPDQSSFRPANSANSFSLKCTLFGFEATMLMVNVVCTYNLLYFSKTTTID